MRQASSRFIALIKQHPLRFIICLSTVTLLAQLALFGVYFSGDTKSYFDAWIDIKNGTINTFRTPPYPIFIGILSMFGNYLIVFVQMAIFLLSIKYFWYLCYKVTSNKRITFVTTLLYAMAIGIADFSITLCTECLSISGVIFLIALLVRIYEKFKYKYAIGVVLLTLFLVLLRPSFLYLLIVIAIVSVVWLFSKKRKQSAVLVSSLIVSLVSLISYCKAVESKTGVFMLSTVSFINDEWIIHLEDLNDRLNFNKPELIDFQSHFYDKEGVLHDDFIYEMNEFPDKVHSEFLKEAKKQIGVTWYSRSLLRFYESFAYKAFYSYSKAPLVYVLLNFTPIKMSILYEILFIYTIILIYISFKRKKINWFNWMILLCCYGNIAVNVIGSYGDWSRLFVPSTPLIFLMVAQVLSCFKRVKSAECGNNGMLLRLSIDKLA